MESNGDRMPTRPALKKSASRTSVMLSKNPCKEPRELIVENVVFPEQSLTASESTKSLKKKKKRAPIPNSFINPTDIFAQNLSAAVMDAKDSADLDVYVYRDKPKHNHWQHDPEAHCHQPHYFYSSTDTDGYDTLPSYTEKSPLRRPVLRSTVSDMTISLKDMSNRRIRPIYNTFYYPPLPLSRTNEDCTPLRKKKALRCHTKIKKSWLTFYVIGALLLVFLFAWSSVFLGSAPLEDIEVVSISNVLGTHKELIFNLNVRARNSNWWTITMTTAVFSVFASSRYVPVTLNHTITQGTDPAEFLGTIYHLEDPLIYQAGALLNSTVSVATSQIQIQSPGSIKDDYSGNERWSLLIRYPYELTIRGVLKYQILPFFSNLSQFHTVRVSQVTRVNPLTGQLSDNAPIPEKYAQWFASENDIL
ncbi:hypothetical protein BY458DRAFT_506573 [Sporodiniella umbellata]|nr:hypothetical protein BY458DRAFT_506573 [Sporodiniella umbellata]